MKTKKNDAGRGFLLFGGLALFILYSLNCFLILPIRNVLASDILYASNLVAINLLSLLANIFEVVAISVFYAAMIVTPYLKGANVRSGAIPIFVAATVFKYAANTAVSWIYDGGIPTAWAWDVVNVFFFTALEAVQVLIVYSLVKGYVFENEQRCTLRAASVSEGNTDDGVYPFSALYSRENCLLRSALACAVATFIAKIVGALLSDVWLIIAYGLPEDPVTWLYMGISYVSKIILGIVVYFAVVLAMNPMLVRNKKKA